jgi:hypothetical protein
MPIMELMSQGMNPDKILSNELHGQEVARAGTVVDAADDSQSHWVKLLDIGRSYIPRQSRHEIQEYATDAMQIAQQRQDKKLFSRLRKSCAYLASPTSRANIVPRKFRTTLLADLEYASQLAGRSLQRVKVPVLEHPPMTFKIERDQVEADLSAKLKQLGIHHMIVCTSDGYEVNLFDGNEFPGDVELPPNAIVNTVRSTIERQSAPKTQGFKTVRSTDYPESGSCGLFLQANGRCWELTALHIFEDPVPDDSIIFEDLDAMLVPVQSEAAHKNCPQTDLPIGIEAGHGNSITVTYATPPADNDSSDDDSCIDNSTSSESIITLGRFDKAVLLASRLVA